MTKVDELYVGMLEDLRMEIIRQYGSVLHFSKITGIDRANLVKVLGRKQGITVNLFLRIARELQLTKQEIGVCSGHTMALEEYWKVDHQEVMNVIFKLLKS